MIISDKHKLVYVTVPKSGSHTGFKLMQDYFEAKGVHNHRTNVPGNLIGGYLVFALVRNPYERFCALYHACVINHVKPHVPVSVRRPLIKYAKWFAGLTEKNYYPRLDLCAPQYRWLDQVNHIDITVQIEKAQEFFDEIYPDKNIKMPHELKREHPKWEDVRTDNLTHYVNIWADKDFEMFGYDKE